ncbi:MAG: VWA domain-containing protein [Clostridia bacterium]|nr:VWA domain-containing protein [Clostridia bacterium]
MKNKISIGLFLIMILIANVSFASYSTVTMNVVEEPICTISLGENSKFEKKLIHKDLANKEVTLQLQVTNEEIADKPTGEIMLVLDDSNSMTTPVAGNTTRKDLIFNSANALISSLLENNTSLKIGVVKFSTNQVISSEGITGTEGTAQDASVVSPLSDDPTALSNAISNIETLGPKTNLQSGLLLASQQFSNEDNNKYIIVLTDGVPNVAIDCTDYYSDTVITKTTQALKDLEAKGIEVITMLTGIDNESETTSVNDKTFGEIIKEVFGTQTNPTVGTFYYVTDDAIEKTITEDIYRALMPIEKTLKDITIVDYFPKEIVQNFNFAYLSKASIGNITATIDTTNNSITWTIPELASGQTATVQYKLKLKENFDSSIVNKILNTNQKVDIDYTDFNDNKQTKTSDISPKIKLTEPPVVLPKAGTITFISLSIVIGGLFIYSIIKLIILHNKMN